MIGVIGISETVEPFLVKGIEYLESAQEALEYFLADPTSEQRWELARTQLLFLTMLARDNYWKAVQEANTYEEAYRTLSLAYGAAVIDLGWHGVEQKDVEFCNKVQFSLRNKLVAIGVEERQCTYWVYPGQSIQRAIDLAPADSTICIKPGTYSEHIVITKGILLRSESGNPEDVKIIGSRFGVPVVAVESFLPTTVRLEGITIAGGLGGSGLYIEGAPILMAYDVHLVDNTGAGLEVTGIALVVIGRALIARNGWQGVKANDRVQALMEDTSIVENGTGLEVSSMKLVLMHCDVSGNKWYGLACWRETTVTIENSTFQRNGSFGIVAGLQGCFAHYADREDLAFNGAINGQGNIVSDVGDPDENEGGALCPAYSGDPWPLGFLADSD